MDRHSKEKPQFWYPLSLFVFLILAACNDRNYPSPTVSIPPSPTARATYIPELSPTILLDFPYCAFATRERKNTADLNLRPPTGIISAMEIIFAAGQAPVFDNTPEPAITIVLDPPQPRMVKVDATTVRTITVRTYSSSARCDLQTVIRDLNRRPVPVVSIDATGRMEDTAPDKPPTLTQLGPVLKRVLKLSNGISYWEIPLTP